MNPLPPAINHVEVETFYQHKDGGLYYTVEVSSSSVDQSRWVVYYHIFPFEQKMWHRPIDEWTPDRFKKVTALEVKEIVSQDQDKFAAQVTENKKARKS